MKCKCDLNIGWTVLKCPDHELPSLRILDGYTRGRTKAIFAEVQLTPKVTFVRVDSVKKESK
jgi:hypothetical protein